MTVSSGIGMQFPLRFGRYRLLQRLGRGGMGSVYLAENTELGDRHEALKVPEVSDLERFRREAAATAKLKHDNLCKIYDYGVIEGNPYLTMELIEGKSLADYLEDKGILPISDAAVLVFKLAEAMRHAHEKGVIHRDLKPSNVMLERVGSRLKPVIVDFGLARRDDPNLPKLSVSGHPIGTILYMAPEQARGDRQSVGPVSDVYSLGVILYELLTGRPPFLGSYVQVLAQLLTQPPRPPSEIRRDLDPRLEAICLRALDKETGEGKRYPTMIALAEALRVFLKTPPSLPPKAPEASSPVTLLPGQKTGVRVETLVVPPWKPLAFVRIEPGTFTMGGNRYDDEEPPHKVRITKAFYLSTHEVTQRQYQEVTGVNPSYFKFKADDRPVERVSWFDAVAFCNKFSEREHRKPCYRINGRTVTLVAGNGYRLPTEAEWEYACRAGSASEYPFGDDEADLGEYAWFSGSSDIHDAPYPVGQKKPNAWGLYDMLGNVWEWCWDGYDEGYYQKSPPDDPSGAPQAVSRVLRGGNWFYGPEICRPALRDASAPGIRDCSVGFRLAAVQDQ